MHEVILDGNAFQSAAGGKLLSEHITNLLFSGFFSIVVSIISMFLSFTFANSKLCVQVWDNSSNIEFQAAHAVCSKYSNRQLGHGIQRQPGVQEHENPEMRHQERTPEPRNREHRNQEVHNDPEDEGSSIDFKVERDERGHCVGAKVNSNDGIAVRTTIHKTVSDCMIFLDIQRSLKLLVLTKISLENRDQHRKSLLCHAQTSLVTNSSSKVTRILCNRHIHLASHIFILQYTPRIWAQLGGTLCYLIGWCWRLR
jgi:hypothetical protein